MAILHVPGRPRIFFQYIDRGERGFVREGINPFFRKSAHEALKIRERHPFIVITEYQVAHAGRHTAIHDGSYSVLFCQSVQLQRIFGKERNIHHIFAGPDDRLQGSVSHESRNGGDHIIEILE